MACDYGDVYQHPVQRVRKASPRKEARFIEPLPGLTPRQAVKPAVARMLALCSREPQVPRLPQIRAPRVSSPGLPSPTSAASAAAAAAAAAMAAGPAEPPVRWQGDVGCTPCALVNDSGTSAVLREIGRDDYRLRIESSEETERLNALRRREQGLRAGRATRQHAHEWSEARRLRQQQQLQQQQGQRSPEPASPSRRSLPPLPDDAGEESSATADGGEASSDNACGESVCADAPPTSDDCVALALASPDRSSAKKRRMRRVARARRRWRRARERSGGESEGDRVAEEGAFAASAASGGADAGALLECFAGLGIGVCSACGCQERATAASVVEAVLDELQRWEVGIQPFRQVLAPRARAALLEAHAPRARATAAAHAAMFGRGAWLSEGECLAALDTFLAECCPCEHPDDAEDLAALARQRMAELRSGYDEAAQERAPDAASSIAPKMGCPVDRFHELATYAHEKAHWFARCRASALAATLLLPERQGGRVRSTSEILGFARYFGWGGAEADAEATAELSHLAVELGFLPLGSYAEAGQDGGASAGEQRSPTERRASARRASIRGSLLGSRQSVSSPRGRRESTGGAEVPSCPIDDILQQGLADALARGRRLGRFGSQPRRTVAEAVAFCDRIRSSAVERARTRLASALGREQQTMAVGVAVATLGVAPIGRVERELVTAEFQAAGAGHSAESLTPAVLAERLVEVTVLIYGARRAGERRIAAALGFGAEESPLRDLREAMLEEASREAGQRSETAQPLGDGLVVSAKPGLQHVLRKLGFDVADDDAMALAEVVTGREPGFIAPEQGLDISHLLLALRIATDERQAAAAAYVDDRPALRREGALPTALAALALGASQGLGAPLLGNTTGMASDRHGREALVRRVLELALAAEGQAAASSSAVDQCRPREVVRRITAWAASWGAGGAQP